MTITNSVFNMDRPDDSAYSLLLEYDSNVAATLTRNLFMNVSMALQGLGLDTVVQPRTRL